MHSFRDQISTVSEKGKRVWIYPKKQKGRYYTARTLLSILLLAFLFGSPFIKISGHPFMLFNIFERHFIIFGLSFSPQDFYLFVLLTISGLIFIVLFTAVFGRLFCGWVCPQTVFMEMVYRRIENWIEGDSAQQRALENSPVTGKKFFKKSAKHIIFAAIAFLIGNTLMAYLIGIDKVFNIISKPPSENLSGFIAVFVFSGIFYFVFSYFREQACVIVCPYGRLQGVLLDPSSLVVAYDHVRGEPRGKLSKEETTNGDCIDCHLCVAVCPTGIDIRNGTQLECVNCTSCIDACDSIMDKVEKQKGLIRYASAKGIIEKTKFKLNKRAYAYTALLAVLLTVFVILFNLRTELDVNVLRAPGKVYQEQPDNKVSNLYSIKFVNNTFEKIPVIIKVDNPDAELKLVGSGINVEPQSVFESEFLIVFSKEKLSKALVPLNIQVFASDKPVREIKTSFLAPYK